MAVVMRAGSWEMTPRELSHRVLHGDIRLPSFPRSYRWERRDVEELFDSVLRGYPIGSLLMWRRPAGAGTVTVGPLTADVDATPDALWVIDGIQRVTSLVGALNAAEETVDPRFRIFYDPRLDEFVSADRRDHVPEHWFPMSSASDTARLLHWQRKARLDDAQLERCHNVVRAVDNYRLAVQVVDSGDEAELQEVFRRISRPGRLVRPDEVFGAIRTTSGRVESVDLPVLASRVARWGFGEIPETALARSVLATREDQLDREFIDELGSDAERREAFSLAERALGATVDFLRHDVGIPHARLVPYMLAFPVLTRFTVLFGPPEGRAAELLRRWIWRGAALGMTPRGEARALREYGRAVEGDPVSSADRLLKLLPPYEAWEPDLNAVHLDQVQAKVNLLGLLSLRPRIIGRTSEFDDRAGTVTDPNGLMERERDPLVRITSIPREFPRGFLANRVIHPRTVSGEDIRGALLRGEPDPDVLESHLIDAEGLGLLRAGMDHEFVAHRAGLVRAAIAEHVQENALFGFPDGPDLTSLITPGDAG
ncbi:DUF262 domain-containing protein [Planomonospora sp. ID91781]|uniref:DUF262 domain-containing protein n=1 Tax=Planomonospora sp. ID91781 TaxID=2738135 RepID=UPI0018C43537|nr:DUF262 domain-containing protein [Planomonospora sp. ID91781]MBG0820193.1 DUF262 domain-containing protein [Planomonospora sp. ID91781]